MDDSWKKDFRTISRYSDGTLFIRAKDKAYRGFNTLLTPNTSLDQLYNDYEAFKEVVDQWREQSGSRQ